LTPVFRSISWNGSDADGIGIGRLSFRLFRPCRSFHAFQLFQAFHLSHDGSTRQ
jgi:hypothetical protein